VESGPNADQAILNQQNQQLDSVGGCNAIKSRDLEIGVHVRSPPPLPISSVLNHLAANFNTLSIDSTDWTLPKALHYVALRLRYHVRVDLQRCLDVRVSKLALKHGYGNGRFGELGCESVPKGMKAGPSS
jgi:hypothetical protein